MGLKTIATVAALGLASLTATEADTPKGMILTQAGAAPSLLIAQAYVQPAGDYMTTPEGCTYRKTQAPGYPPRWILVVNPHHVGMAPARTKCPGMR